MPLGSDPAYKNQKLKIGQTTKTLRNDKNNPYNSPLNMLFISKDSNRTISDMDYKDYSQNSKIINVLPSIDCPTVISDNFTLDNFLTTRYNGLKSKLTGRLDSLYSCLTN